MILRYGQIDENVRGRSVDLTVDRAGVRAPAASAGGRPASLNLRNGAYLGKMAVTAAANALCASGRDPEVFSPVILLPPETEEMTLRQLTESICRTCAQMGIRTGHIHAEVTSAVTRPVVSGACEGSPFAEAAEVCGTGPFAAPAEVREGSHIVMTKWAGLEGTWLLAAEREEILRERFPQIIISRARSAEDLLSVRKEASIAAAAGAEVMIEGAAGGIWDALWRLSARTRRGFAVDMHAIPFLQETIEITNYLGVHPYRMRSAGCLLAVTEDAPGLIGRLAQADIPAARIGTMTDNRDKLLINRGEKRYLDRPEADSLLAFFDS